MLARIGFDSNFKGKISQKKKKKKKINAWIWISQLHCEVYCLDPPPLGGDGCRGEEEGSDNDAELEALDNSKNKENVKSKTEEAETAPLRGMFVCLFVYFCFLFSNSGWLAISLATKQREAEIKKMSHL